MTHADRAKTHLCLVSAQATPNITPVIDPAFQPDEVILLVSPDMKTRAGWLAGVLAARGVRISTWEIEDAWDVEHVMSRVWALLEQRESEDIALNATGGTKPMSIAAHEVFRDWDKPIFYVHPEHDRLVWLHPSARAPIELADRVRLEAFLLAHGAAVEGGIQRDQVKLVHEIVAENLVRDLRRFRPVLSKLNALAVSAERNGLNSTQRLTDPMFKDAALSQLIDELEQQGLAKRRSDRLTFPDEASRFFVAGGWLESYVFQVITSLGATLRSIQDRGRSITVRRETPRGHVTTEVDVAFLADNRLHIVECKTGRLDPGDRPERAMEAVYRLDSLRDLLGGLQARAMLVSYQDVRPEDKQRATDLGVHVCAGDKVQSLRSELLEWVGHTAR